MGIKTAGNAKLGHVGKDLLLLCIMLKKGKSKWASNGDWERLWSRKQGA